MFDEVEDLNMRIRNLELEIRFKYELLDQLRRDRSDKVFRNGLHYKDVPEEKPVVTPRKSINDFSNVSLTLPTGSKQ